MSAVEFHTTLAVLWSGAGLARSVVLASSPGPAGSDLPGAADTVISREPPGSGGVAGPRPPWPSQNVPGQRFGRYRLIERLGRGCQGDVWRAVPVEPDADAVVVEVALKLLPPALARDPRRLAQFRREAERRARLAVPSVLPTSEYGEAEGILFMAMPLVDGCSLAEVVAWRRRNGMREAPDPRHPLADAPPAEYLRRVVRALAQVARTLDHVHTSCVVHRDIKPANILLDRHRAEGVFLCDFGLARDLDVATPEQLRDGAGTPLYMPPERLLRLRSDEIRCDVYALGATLYEAVTLRPPVQIPDNLPWTAWMSYLATTTPEPPRSIRPDIPDALEAIILRTMAHEPFRRHPTAGRVADDLERFLDQLRDDDRTATGEGAPRASAPLSSALPPAREEARTRQLSWRWDCMEIAATSPAGLCASLTRLCHPDVDACKAPIAAE